MRTPRFPKKVKIFFAAWVLFVVLGLAVFGVILYVLFHFIAKFW